MIGSRGEKMESVKPDLAPTIIRSGNEPEFVEVKVKRDTPVDKLAGSITKFIQNGKIPVLLPIGLPAQNQAMKAAAKSKQYLAPVGKYVLWDLCFATREVYSQEQDKVVPRSTVKIIAVVFNSSR